MKIAIVGAGIVGLAHAYRAVKSGHEVVLFERNHRAIGASVRNFGLIWPIGQPAGPNLELALMSRAEWLDLSEKAGFWLNNNGSIHLAYHQDEWAVLNEFADFAEHQQVKLIKPEEVKQVSPYVKPQGLLGGLLSKQECTVNPREALPKLAAFLQQLPGVELFFDEAVLEIALPAVITSRRKIQADQVIICSGTDYQTLFPEVFKAANLSKCKLQMMKGYAKGDHLLGPTLCAGLTLTHYTAFANCASLQDLNDRLSRDWPGYHQHGIHVMLAQNEQLELIIGDSHQYGSELSPFDLEEIDAMILKYLHTFTSIDSLQITERWHGIYSKLESDNIYIREQPVDNVTVVTGLGGAGMTLSFGIAEETISHI